MSRAPSAPPHRYSDRNNLSLRALSLPRLQVCPEEAPKISPFWTLFWGCTQPLLPCSPVPRETVESSPQRTKSHLPTTVNSVVVFCLSSFQPSECSQQTTIQSNVKEAPDKLLALLAFRNGGGVCLHLQDGVDLTCMWMA